MAGGSGGGRNPDGTKKARIEVIPLIDVIFFLLATFVLFTLSLNKSEGIAVSLPDTATSVPRDPAGSYTISVTSEGTLGWNKDPISLDEFLERLKVVYQQEGKDAVFLINGDEAAFFSQARYVFDEIRKAGFTKVKIETQVLADA